MRILFFFLIIFNLTASDLCGQKSGELVGVKKQADPIKSLPKELKVFYKDMVYIPAGTFVSGDDPTDSTRKERVISVSPFYMASKEVTNKQYREFYESKVKEMGIEKAVDFLPHQGEGSIHLPDLTNIQDDSLYFFHTAYNEYPVTGVSWKQANAYCQWLSSKVRDTYKGHEGWETKYAMPDFRLPTEMEWEYAAYGGLNRALYSFGSNVFDKKKIGGYNANFGLIKDEKGLGVKQPMDDGYFTAGNVKSFAPNGYGLYNMSGNVNEWVLDVYRENTNRYDFNRDISPEYRMYDPEQENKKDNRVIKGGGFLDPPYYLLVSSRRQLNPDEGRCDVGFRVCMTYIGSYSRADDL